MMINNEHIQGPGNPKEPRKLTWLIKWEVGVVIMHDVMVKMEA